MNVLKFGGTSVATASAMGQVKDIIEKTNGSVVVLSACGGVTNRLLEAVRLAGNGQVSESAHIIQEIELRHLDLCRDLILDGESRWDAISKIKTVCVELRVFCEGVALLGECTPRSIDTAGSFGERLSTLIFWLYCRSEGMNTILFDAREIMRTDSNFTSAKINFNELQRLTTEKLIPLLTDNTTVITQGFIGADSRGITTTLGRGGSDLSAALIGAALSAHEILIYTDVSGIASADPRIIPSAKPIPEMSFAEARELSFYGAKVLHPETILPAVERGIPVRVLNTFAPDEAGTVIVSEATREHGICAVTLKRNCVCVTSHGLTFADAVAFLGRIANYTSEVYSAVIGESKCFAVIDTPKDTTALENLTNGAPSNTSIQEVTLLCGVGIGLNGHIATKFSESVSNFSPFAILYGASDVGIIALLPPQSADDALRAVHQIIE
ncbi:MAG: aspartate kinase [Bacteroidetes bacterium]|nr:aspartate kinase [Bacteroidota bacterium]